MSDNVPIAIKCFWTKARTTNNSLRGTSFEIEKVEKWTQDNPGEKPSSANTIENKRNYKWSDCAPNPTKCFWTQSRTKSNSLRGASMDIEKVEKWTEQNPTEKPSSANTIENEKY